MHTGGETQGVGQHLAIEDGGSLSPHQAGPSRWAHSSSTELPRLASSR